MNSNLVIVPFFRIDSGKYMIGAEIFMPQMKNGVCIIKRNGLNETLDVFMSRNGQQMIERVQQMIDMQHISYADAFKTLLMRAFDKDTAKATRYFKKYQGLIMRQSQSYNEPDLLSSARQRLFSKNTDREEQV